MLREDCVMECVGTSADMYSAGVVLFEMVSDYDLNWGARHWQQPPPERDFPVLSRLCFELMDTDPTRRPAAEQLLARPEIGGRANRRALEVQRMAGPQEVFPNPEATVGVRYNQLAQHAPARNSRKALF
jgi:hypothetical protein